MLAEEEVELARRARAAHGKGVVVIDGAVALRCATEGRFSYDVTMRAVLPYAGTRYGGWLPGGNGA